MSRFNPEVSYNRMNTDDVLTKLRVIDLNSAHCTFAGLLFFGKRTSIERFFPDFRIDLLEIPGTSYQEAPSRYSFRLSEDDYENLWEVYFECFKRLRKEVDVNFTITANGFGQELSPGLKSIREALVNMLIHADYFSPSRSRIRIFTNHIECYNPGGFPKPIDEIKGKDLSIPRNPILAKLFRMVKLAENAGYGLDYMENNWKEYNGAEVTFVIDFDSTIVKFPLQNEVVDKAVKRKGDATMASRWHYDGTTMTSRLHHEFGATAVLIIRLVMENQHITIDEMVEKSNTSKRTVQRVIQKLKAAKIIDRKGPNLGGYWCILKDVR